MDSTCGDHAFPNSSNYMYSTCYSSHVAVMTSGLICGMRQKNYKSITVRLVCPHICVLMCQMAFSEPAHSAVNVQRMLPWRPLPSLSCR